MGGQRKSLQRKLRRFGRARRGAAAVEFALVAVPFFLLVFGMAEISMIGFAQTSLNNAVSETARQIRTGQAQKGGVSAGEIREMLCEELNAFISMECDGRLYLDVNRFDSFVTAGAAANPIQNGEFQDPGFGYTPGAPSDIVVVRAYYRWHIITPMFEGILGNVSGGQRVLVSTMMFRNEPYL